MKAPQPQQQQHHSQQNVDAHILKKNNSLFHQRRILFKESTRLDLKQERLKKKYRPVNVDRNGLANGNSTAFTASSPHSSSLANGKASSLSSSTVTEDANGFRLPARILFSKEKVRLGWGEPVPIGPGLGNLGNTCFLNSVLQCLTYTPPLAAYLLSSQHSNSCKTTNFCMFCMMEKHVVRCFSKHERDTIHPKNIVGRLRSIGKQFRLGRQEDSHEFARHLIDALQTACLMGYDSKLDDRIKETTVVHQIFGGYYQSQIKCLKCGYESNTFEPNLDVSLEIRNADSVEKALASFVKPEFLTKSNQYQCDKCKAKVDARKGMTIYEAPKVLSIHLKRFTAYGAKVNKPVDFDVQLDLTPYMSTNKKHGTLRYSLYAVLVHSGGSCNSGHYYCFVKASSGAWYSMNDSYVHQVSLATVLKQSAYMLFYIQESTGKVKSSTPLATANGNAKAANTNGTSKLSNGIQHTQANGTLKSPVSIIQKRPTLDLDEVGAKVERSTVNGKRPDGEKSTIISGTGPLLTKKERKRAKRLARELAEKQAKGMNDYELATAVKSGVESLPLAKATPGPNGTNSLPVKEIKKKGLSPLADLDLSPATLTSNKPFVQLRSPTEWKITEGSSKSNGNDTFMKARKSPKDSDSEEDTASHGSAQSPLSSAEIRSSLGSTNSKDDNKEEEEVNDGWTVKPRPAVSAAPIVVAHNETSISKREKLQQLIARESGFKSQEVKEAMMQEVKHMLGSKVSTWDESSSLSVQKAREDVLRTMKPKHHRPDAYDADYDRGKVKKVKTKNVMDGPAVGATVANKFQKEQDVRNIVKPKFNKHNRKFQDHQGKKLQNAL